MANHKDTSKPPQDSSRRGGESHQPLDPPLPPAQSAPNRQGPPVPNPLPDDPPRDQRLRDGGMPQVDPGALTSDQRVGTVTEPHIPQKFRRPLPQPGDNDYVAGMPVNEEEAARMEALEEERYAYAIQAGKDAEARHRERGEPPHDQWPASPPPKHPDDDDDHSKEKKHGGKDRS